MSSRNILDRIQNIKELTHAFHKSILNDGLVKTAYKVLRYLRKKRDLPIKNHKKYQDILFINGTELNHPYRYRVEHQIEQLRSHNIICDSIFYESLSLKELNYYSGFIFFRCPITEIIREFITEAKKLNKTIYFDIDDLVIDTKYTDQIKYVQSMQKKDRELYDSGVRRIQETLKLCEYAITTTTTLKQELENYPNFKEIFINRNVASDEMFFLSEIAYKKRKKKRKYIRLGYFSGSITHNPDFELIKSAIKRLLEDYNNIKLVLCGLIDLPEDLKEYEKRIEIRPFVDWRKLPEEIARVDINLAPIEDTIFNRAKSENKWTEAGLVRVPTVASKVGAFAEVIKHNEDGILVENTEYQWYQAIKELIDDPIKRKKIGKTAYERIKNEYITIYSGKNLAKYVSSKLRQRIVFFIPSIKYSGGLRVILKHAKMLQRHGNDVTLFNEDISQQNINSLEGIPVINKADTLVEGHIDIAVATLWTTLYTIILTLPRVKIIKYLVQNFETDFYQQGDTHTRVIANATYNMQNLNIEYTTISKWCQYWLENKFEIKNVKYAPNGIDLNLFKYKKRKNNDEKIRILIEGNQDYYKNVDESFKIANQLDKNLFEVWYVSYSGKPKKWYKLDKFISSVPFDKMPEIYQQCDILLKSSILESFSYPPLEMLACGGFVVVRLNEGNKEYINDDIAFTYTDPSEAVKFLKSIKSKKQLIDIIQSKRSNVLELLKKRDWNNIENDIINLYS